MGRRDEDGQLMGGFSLEESRGIYIEGGNRIYAAEWVITSGCGAVCGGGRKKEDCSRL